MTNTLYLLNYNNYSDRIFKREETLNDYLTYAVNEVYNVNFNPNDGVVTNHIVNLELKGANYVVVIDEYNEIVSRWFILDAVRVRGGQYNIELYRDLVVDYYDTVIESPCFIEKAIVESSDAAIFNKEDMTVNQIKTDETLLKDTTDTSWLVGYIARTDTKGDSTALSVDVLPDNAADFVIDTREDLEQDLPLAGPVIGNLNNYTLSIKARTNYQVFGGGHTIIQPIMVKTSSTGTVGSDYITSNQSGTANSLNMSATSITSTDTFNTRYSSTYNDLLNYLPTIIGLNVQSANYINNMLNYNNSTVFIRDEGRRYRITIQQKNKSYYSPYDGNIIDNQDEILFAKLDELWNLEGVDPTDNQASGKWYSYSLGAIEYTVIFEDLGAFTADLSFSLPVARTHLTDAPYDMICAPFDTIQVKLADGTTMTSYSSYVLKIFTELAKQYSGDSGVLYDVQRLPYCPIPSLETVNGVLNAQQWSSNTQSFMINQSLTPVGIVFSCEQSNFTRPLVGPTVNISNTKVESMCDQYRICSPNYNGIFEINAAMNGGLLGFTTYCTYKPYNPYIQVSPLFNRLYGADYADARGLICGGDWSMPIVTSAWATYERQNANYQTIFDRQIQNMEVQHAVAREQEIWGAIAGTAQGAVTGGAAGMFVGGPIGAGIGAGAGAVLSGIGGVLDYKLNERLRNEALDFAQDQFGAQLGNIKALPMSLAKTSAFTVNNKIFPFLEYYTCTEEEKEALANKVAYNGMTVMRIGKIKDYIGRTWTYKDISARNYIKGKLIRCDNLNDDYHVAKQLIKEINQGIYFGG